MAVRKTGSVEDGLSLLLLGCCSTLLVVEVVVVVVLVEEEENSHGHGRSVSRVEAKGEITDRGYARNSPPLHAYAMSRF